MRAPETMVALESVGKRYGEKEVLSNVSFTVGQGECLALVGHNGAGKTTLIKLILGLTRPTSGRLRIQGEDPISGSAVAHHMAVGVLPESVVFHNAMTGLEVMRFYARLKRLETSCCLGLLSRFGLADAAKQRVGTYSKGMRQRLGLAQAVMGNPRLLLFDEPTSGLDPAFRRNFYELLASQRKAGTTVILSSHALTEIEARSDRVAIMNKGRLVACGSLEELRSAAKLRVQIRVTVAAGAARQVVEQAGSLAEVRIVDSHTVDLSCSVGDKMEIVRWLSVLGGAVKDIDIRPPMLEEIYERLATGDAPCVSC